MCSGAGEPVRWPSVGARWLVDTGESARVRAPDPLPLSRELQPVVRFANDAGTAAEHDPPGTSAIEEPSSSITLTPGISLDVRDFACAIPHAQYDGAAEPGGM